MSRTVAASALTTRTETSAIESAAERARAAVDRPRVARDQRHEQDALDERQHPAGSSRLLPRQQDR